MINDSFLYKFYYQWWKNIDKSIFFLITLLFVIGLFFSLVSTSLIVSNARASFVGSWMTARFTFLMLN